VLVLLLVFVPCCEPRIAFVLMLGHVR
jgi:hypothetical protein